MDEERASKRTKLYGNIFDNPTLARSPNDVLDNGLDDDSGYIPCKCFMTWRPTKRKHKAILESTRTIPSLRFDVEFSGDCQRFFTEIELKAQDELLLALTSAQIEKIEAPSRSCTLPLKLVYEQGVIIKFVKRPGGPCVTVDTWQLSEEARIREVARARDAARADEDSWFLEPVTPMEGDEQAAPQGHGEHSLNASETTTPVILLPSIHNMPAVEKAPASPVQQITHEKPEDVKLSKKQARRNLKAKRALERASASEQPTTFGAISATHYAAPLASAIPKKPDPLIVDIQSIPVQATPQVSNVTDGLVTATGRYHRLGDLRDLSGPVQFNTIGVVIGAFPPKRTRTGELSCSLKLADPSNTMVENLSGNQGFRFICFAKEDESWLPQPNLGDVLVMRDLLLSSYQGNPNGVGQSGRLQWAIYSPSTGKVCYGDLKNTSGPGSFSPFFNPDEAVIRYCLKLADWWAEINKNSEQQHQIGNWSNMGDHSFYTHERRHRLISEASPSAPPSGYFDCVVEILHSHLNDNGVYSLYVTDYTINTALPAVAGAWCPDSLSKYVLKMEAWDSAAEMARSMYAGDYYLIKNARMMVSRGGYIEGKVVEKKIQRLIAEEAGVENPHLKALLERKKTWQDANTSTDSDRSFEFKAISEAVEGQHFHCVVEVLHTVPGGDGVSCIYVTDYSVREELVSGRVKQSWGGAGLDGRILRIGLFNNQAEMAKLVEVGSFYKIMKLRMKQIATASEFQGSLGGAERLIHEIDQDDIANERLQTLKRRKKEWQKGFGITSPEWTSKNKIPTDHKAPDRAKPIKGGKTIAELRSDKKCPNKNRIVARVIDFRPWNLSDAIIIHCTCCKQDLPPLQKACFKCDDSDHEHVQYKYQMYFMLEDGNKNELQVSVHDGSSLFDGLQRGELAPNSKAYRALSHRLTGILGDLLELHTKPIPEDDSPCTLPDTPMRSLIIDSWEVDGKRVHCLAHCDDLEY